MLKTILEAPLDELMDIAGHRYSVKFEPVAVADENIEVLQLTNMDEYVEALARHTGDGPLELPFWSKIWPSDVLLSFFIGRLPARGRTMLELNAGASIAGLLAARKGFQVTFCDTNEDALLFTRINVLRNGLQDNAQIARVDVSKDALKQRYDVIIGHELLYHEDTFRPLVKFLLRHLSQTPEAEVVLALDYARKAKKFFQLAEREFSIQSQAIGCKGGDTGNDRHLCAIHRLKPKKPL